jgi:hypothetical protein
MDLELKKKWCAALRSGKFQQGKEFLYNHIDDAYCCLGVLCVIAGKDHDPDGAMLGKSLLEEFELKRNDAVRLACYNDGCIPDSNQAADRKTFLEIADIIESEAEL